MSNNPNRTPSPAQQRGVMSNALKFFLAGCLAELYVLVLRHFYVNGTLQQVVAWDGYLTYFLYGGIALLALGLVFLLIRKKWNWSPAIGLWTAGAGAFFAGATALIRLYYSTAISLLCILVPVMMVLAILWCLYDRECAWSLSVLSFSLVALWVARRGMDSPFVGTLVKIGVVVCLILVAAVALAVFQADRHGGQLGKLRLFPEEADALPIYVSCAMAAVGLILSFFSATLVYYVMWIMGVVLFALAVYYTAKQL